MITVDTVAPEIAVADLCILRLPASLAGHPICNEILESDTIIWQLILCSVPVKAARGPADGATTRSDEGAVTSRCGTTPTGRSEPSGSVGPTRCSTPSSAACWENLGRTTRLTGLQEQVGKAGWHPPDQAKPCSGRHS